MNTWLFIGICERTAAASETFVGGLFCGALSLLVPTACLVGLIGDRQGGIASTAVAIVITTGSLLLSISCMLLIVGGWRDGIGPSIALRQLRLPLFLRPFVAAWWAAHFMIGTALSFAIERVATGPAGGPWLTVAAYWGFIAVAVFSLTFAANFYLLLCVTALARAENLVRWLWRWRISIDVMITAVALFTSYHLR